MIEENGLLKHVDAAVYLIVAFVAEVDLLPVEVGPLNGLVLRDLGPVASLLEGLDQIARVVTFRNGKCKSTALIDHFN